MDLLATFRPLLSSLVSVIAPAAAPTPIEELAFAYCQGTFDADRVPPNRRDWPNGGRNVIEAVAGDPLVILRTATSTAPNHWVYVRNERTKRMGYILEDLLIYNCTNPECPAASTTAIADFTPTKSYELEVQKGDRIAWFAVSCCKIYFFAKNERTGKWGWVPICNTEQTMPKTHVPKLEEAIAQHKRYGFGGVVDVRKKD